MNTKLITALRTAAKAIEDGTFNYDWTRTEQCNCGVVFCALTGHSPSTLPVPTAPGARMWNEIAGYHCPITGTPVNELFKELISSGLTPKDIGHLEFLDDPEIIKRLPAQNVRRGLLRRWTQEPMVPKKDNPKHLVLYLRAWADLLVEQGRQDMPEPQIETPCENTQSL